MTTRDQPGGWAVGGTIFAGSMMLLIGAYGIIEGLVGIIDDDFFVVRGNYTFNLDATGWGWIHLILGAIVLLVGLGVLTGQSWALMFGIVLVILNAIAHFFFIPYYPVWSIIVIAIDVFIVWSLGRVVEFQRTA